MYKERYTHTFWLEGFKMKPEMIYWRGKHSCSRDIVVTCARPAKKLMDVQTDVM